MRGHTFWRPVPCTCLHHRVRIDLEFPKRLEPVLAVALADGDANRRARPRESDRLVKSANGGTKCRRGFPFAVHRGEPARVDDAIRSAIDDHEAIFPQVCSVDELTPASGPW